MIVFLKHHPISVLLALLLHILIVWLVAIQWQTSSQLMANNVTEQFQQKVITAEPVETIDQMKTYAVDSTLIEQQMLAIKAEQDQKQLEAQRLQQQSESEAKRLAELQKKQEDEKEAPC